MENMGLMTIVTPLIPLIPFIPPIAVPENTIIPECALLITDGPPAPKAWLTETGELRTRGIFPGDYPDGGLTPEIIRLTAENMPLQAKLLRENVAYYSAPTWIHTIRQWRERARILFEVDDLDLHAANWKAAEERHLLAFAGELMLKGSP
jgi:hypothetical protein